MKYIVYQTINKINNKIYIGVHQTEDPNQWDYYLGCGAYANSPKTYQNSQIALHKAICKYGVNAFRRITLKVFDNLQDALNLEKELVNEDFIKRSDVYNMTLGGGNPPILNKRVYQFDLNGVLIKEWASVKEVTNFYKLSKDVISICINSKRSFKDFYWSHDKIIDISTFTMKNKFQVYKYDKNGILMNIYDSCKIASLDNDLMVNKLKELIQRKCLYEGHYYLTAYDNIEMVMNHIQPSTNDPIYMYNSAKQFVKSFSNYREAAQLLNISADKLRKAGLFNMGYKGYLWSYQKADTYPGYHNIRPTKVAQYDLNGNLIKIWDRTIDCKKEFPGYNKVAKGTQKTYKGYIFKYIN